MEIRFRIESKLVLCFMAIACCVLVAGASNVKFARFIGGKLNDIVNDRVPRLSIISDLRSSAFHLMEAGSSIAMIRVVDPSDQSALESELEEHAEQVAAFRAGMSILEAEAAEDGRTLDPTLLELASELMRVSGELIAFAPEKTPRERLDDLGAVEHVESEISTALQNLLLEEMDLLKGHASLLDVTIDRFLLSHYLWVGGIAIFSVALGVMFARHIARPIRELQQVVRGLGFGSLEMSLPRYYRDEIGDLAESFREMLSRLRSTLVSRHFLESILDSIRDAVIVVSGEGMIRLGNRAATQLLGVEGDGLVGRRVDDVLPVVPSSGSSTTETLYIGSSRIPVPVTIVTFPLEDSDIPNPGCVLVVRDLRDELRVREELRAYRERLERAERLAELGTLGAIVAHKFAQPLSSIRLFLQQVQRTLSRESVPALVHENLETCLEELERAAQIIGQVLGAARRSEPAEQEPVSLHEIGKSTISALSLEASERGVRMSCEGLTGLPVFLGVRAQLEEMFYIIVQNAIQASAESISCTLDMEGRVDNGKIVIRFRDSAQGIPPEHLDKVFDLFFSMKERGRGSGIGLSIVKQIVSNHGGSISVESVPERGSIFTIVLPYIDHGPR